jgi:hypothetical protein
VAALSTIHLTPAKTMFRGVADRGDRLPKVPAIHKDPHEASKLWQAQLGRWRSLSEQLAGDFLAGRALRDPASAQVCRVCHLHVFCRISEIGSSPEDSSPDASADE